MKSFLKSIQEFTTSELELLLDWYGLCGKECGEELFKDQINIVKAELELRNTSLGRELM